MRCGYKSYKGGAFVARDTLIAVPTAARLKFINCRAQHLAVTIH
jgi:hypothetical protein